MNPHQLPDGTISFKDFVGNRNNRFSNPDAAHKNRIQNPSKVLHFFNAPPHLGEKDISEVSAVFFCLYCWVAGVCEEFLVSRLDLLLMQSPHSLN